MTASYLDQLPARLTIHKLPQLGRKKLPISSDNFIFPMKPFRMSVVNTSTIDFDLKQGL